VDDLVEARVVLDDIISDRVGVLVGDAPVVAERANDAQDPARTAIGAWPVDRLLLGSTRRLSSEELVRQLDGVEVPSEQPVEEERVVVASLVGLLVADGELVGELEQGRLIIPEQLGLEQLPSHLQDAGQRDDRRTALLHGGCSRPKQRDGVLHSVDRLRCGRLHGPLRQVFQTGRFDPNEATDVLALLGESQAERTGRQ
jgi:hypothetical protein